MLPSPRLLAAARTLIGITQSQLAVEAGLSANTVKKLERGDANPTLATMDRVLKAYSRLGVEFLLDADGAYEGVRRQREPGS